VSRVLTSGDVPDPIEDYLDRLLAAIPLGTPGARRLLAEAEGHLRDAVDDAVSRGVPPDDAAFAAIARFGPPRVVARAWRSARVTTGAIVATLARSALALAVVGLLAIGASGAVAQVMRSVAGPDFVASDVAGVRYTAARCADFRRLEPHASTCADAAVAHHADEVVWYRLDAGVLGVLGAAALAVVSIRRRRRHDHAFRIVPASLVPAVGATAFGLGAAGLGAMGVDAMVVGGAPGQYLSGAVVSAVVAAAFAVVAVRRLVGGDDAATYATVW
jgi:hypothetical protein